MRNHRVGIAMNNEEARTFLIHVGNGTANCKFARTKSLLFNYRSLGNWGQVPFLCQ